MSGCCHDGDPDLSAPGAPSRAADRSRRARSRRDGPGRAAAEVAEPEPADLAIPTPAEPAVPTPAEVAEPAPAEPVPAEPILAAAPAPTTPAADAAEPAEPADSGRAGRQRPSLPQRPSQPQRPRRRSRWPATTSSRWPRCGPGCGCWTPAQVQTLLDYEKAHESRAAVITMFERRIAKLEQGG